MTLDAVSKILQAVLLACGKAMTVEQLIAIFGLEDGVNHEQVVQALQTLRVALEGSALELVQVASGFRVQVRAEFGPYVSRLWEERPQKYSRALLETLALIAYRQPITRGEIEDIRGVAVSTQIIRTLQEREWVRIAGHRDVPGRPALLVTTRLFLDAFGLKRLSDLPSLAALRDLDQINAELNLTEAGQNEQNGLMMAKDAQPHDDFQVEEHE
ncbi:MAG: SMC-Scp complex subunit ScpB [Pseudomonadales bacterium]|nr:SMC-Scp complex subunit ScpB [Pseudomonadales bacterium]